MNHVALENIDWSLYAIIDEEWLKGQSLEKVTQQICRGGCGVIQYRDKRSTSRVFYNNAKQIRKITSHYQIPLIINDRIDIALTIDADGVHLGQHDVPWEQARLVLGDKKIIGGSVHTVDEFNLIKMCDYIGVGALYPTFTKKEVRISGISFLKEIRSRTKMPIIGIGGITIENVASVIQAGADGVALISWLLNDNDIQKRTQQMASIIKSLKLSK